MPTVFLIEGFRVEVRTQDHRPPHVHVIKAGQKAKIWLDTMRASPGSTMTGRDRDKAVAIVAAHADELWRVWRQIHG